MYGDSATIRRILTESGDTWAVVGLSSNRSRAAYGVAEVFGWPATLQAKAPDAVGFYGIIAAATIIGFGLGFTNVDPIKMLIWSAVINGIVAVPIMAVMMLIISRIDLMGRFRAKTWLEVFGWAGTGLMGIAVVALLWSSLL